MVLIERAVLAITSILTMKGILFIPQPHVQLCGTVMKTFKGYSATILMMLLVLPSSMFLDFISSLTSLIIARMEELLLLDNKEKMIW